MSEARLFFCVGATKAGTSWLYETLAAHPEVHLRSIKELHFFDALEDGRIQREMRAHGAEHQRLSQKLMGMRRASAMRLRQRIADRADWIETLERGDKASYLDYLIAGRGNVDLVGDVTPAYALLPVARLRQMANLLPDVRFLYVVRDPVARLWSHVRMIAKRRGEDGLVDPQRARNILRRTMKGEEQPIARRSDYAGALARLTDAIDPKRLLVTFYEEMFSPEGLARICHFLGIAAIAPQADLRVHAGHAVRMDETQMDKARAWLAPQYDAVERHLGKLPEAWQRNMVRV